LALSAAAVLLAPQTVGAEGFSINEWSAEGFAMGGARMFAENDAANMAYNPASLTKIKGEVAKISATYISPHGKYKTYGLQQDGNPVPGSEAFVTSGNNRVHPAWAPGSYYVKQMNDKEWIGLGAYARFGNSCQFEPGSFPGVNNTSAKINGMSIGVNYAKKLDSKWSASLGAEVNYAWLQMDKTAPFGVNIPGNNGSYSSEMKAQIEGESYALGWNAAVNYAFDDKNEMGVVYRSAVNHSMEANVRDNMLAASLIDPSYGGFTDAYGCVTLPESVMIGYGHKFNDKTRVELNGTWTRWSRFDSFDITFDGFATVPNPKNWKDGWRYAIGIEHKLSDKYSLLGGIAYDESAIPDYPEQGADFMVPTGTRTTFTIGTQYHDDRQTVAFTLGWMKVGDLHIAGGHADPYIHADMYDSYTKLFSISYQYNF